MPLFSSLLVEVFLEGLVRTQVRLGLAKDLSSNPTKDVCPERPWGAKDLSSLSMRTTNTWKQMSFLTVLSVEWGCRYGWKLPTGSAGRVAHAEEEPRLYIRGGAVAGSGHRGEHRHLHHNQRRLPAPAPGRGAFAAGGNVYARYPNDRCQYQFSAHRHFPPQLPGLPRPEHGFLRTGHRHLSHTPELGRPSRAATIERLVG